MRSLESSAYSAASAADSAASAASDSVAYSAGDSVAYSAGDSVAFFAAFSAAYSAADSAASAASAASADSAFSAADSAASAASAASADSAFSAASYSAAFSADSASSAFSADSAASAFSAATRDANAATLWHRLWHYDGMPEGLAAAWERLKKFFNDDLETWGFWLEWYEAILNGEPLPWELSFRIATTLTDADWDMGPAHVAERIEAIRAEFIADSFPLAERVEFNLETAKFRVVPQEIAKPELLGATLSQVEDAIEDVLADPSNGLNQSSRDIKVIRRTLTKYGNNPQQIEMGFTSAHASITRQIVAQELPPSEENLGLQRALEEAAQGIRATHPEIAENRRILDQQKLKELDEGGKAVLAKAQPVLEAISEGQMLEDFREDIPFLLEEKFLVFADPRLGPAERNPILAGYDETRRTIGRSARILIALRQTREIVDMIDSSAAVKIAGWVTIIEQLVKLGLSLI